MTLRGCPSTALEATEPRPIVVRGAVQGKWPSEPSSWHSSSAKFSWCTFYEARQLLLKKGLLIGRPSSEESAALPKSMVIAEVDTIFLTETMGISPIQSCHHANRGNDHHNDIRVRSCKDRFGNYSAQSHIDPLRSSVNDRA
jgi:hypothetical protein